MKKKSVKSVGSVESSLLKIDSAAAYLNVTVFAIRRAIWAGKLAYIKPGNAYLFRKEDLDDFAMRMRVEAS
jgi:excisionase family DNA binding protein